jgi:hypothetical protein
MDQSFFMKSLIGYVRCRPVIWIKSVKKRMFSLASFKWLEGLPSSVLNGRGEEAAHQFRVDGCIVSGMGTWLSLFPGAASALWEAE